MKFGKKSRLLAGVVTTGALLVGGLAMGAPAEAATLAAGAQTFQSTATDSACVQAVEAARRQGQAGLSVSECATTITTQSSAASAITASDLAQARTNMSASSYVSLAAAAASSSVQSRTYSQKITDSFDQVEQLGRFYYNGSRVWISTYAGYTGTHVCIVEYSVEPFGTGTVTNCLDSGSSTNRTLQIYWNVTLGPIKGVGVNWNESSTMHVLSSGSIDY